MGKNGDKLKEYYGALFGWEIDCNNPMAYGMVAREGNINSEGVGIGGASPRAPRATRATSCSTSRCLTWRPRSQRRRASAGRAHGPEEVMDGLV